MSPTSLKSGEQLCASHLKLREGTFRALRGKLTCDLCSMRDVVVRHI